MDKQGLPTQSLATAQSAAAAAGAVFRGGKSDRTQLQVAQQNAVREARTAAFKAIERGELPFEEVQALLAKAASTAAAGGDSSSKLAVLVTFADSTPGERLVDVLLRTKQSALLKRLLDASSAPGGDPLVGLIKAGAPVTLIKAVIEEPHYWPSNIRGAWMSGLTWDSTNKCPHDDLSREHVLAWHALQHPDCKLLELLLSYHGTNPALVLADGSTLLHAAVDLLEAKLLARGAVKVADHVTALINAVRQRLQPADFLADPVSGRGPLDLQWIDYCTPSDGLTALYKVTAGYKAFEHEATRQKNEARLQELLLFRLRRERKHLTRKEQRDLQDVRKRTVWQKELAIREQRQKAQAAAAKAEATKTEGTKASAESTVLARAGNLPSAAEEDSAEEAVDFWERTEAIETAEQKAKNAAAVAAAASSAAEAKMAQHAAVCLVLLSSGADPLRELQPARSSWSRLPGFMRKKQSWETHGQAPPEADSSTGGGGSGGDAESTSAAGSSGGDAESAPAAGSSGDGDDSTQAAGNSGDETNTAASLVSGTALQCHPLAHGAGSDDEEDTTTSSSSSDDDDDTASRSSSSSAQGDAGGVLGRAMSSAVGAGAAVAGRAGHLFKQGVAVAATTAAAVAAAAEATAAAAGILSNSLAGKHSAAATAANRLQLLEADARYRRSLAARTAFDRLAIHDPDDKLKYTEEEFTDKLERYKQRKAAKEAEKQAKAKDKSQKDHLLEEHALRIHVQNPPDNPLVHVAFEPHPSGVQAQMLCSVLQRLLLDSPGDAGSVVRAVRELLDGRPKVLAYVLKTFFVPEKACAAPGSSAGPSAAQRWQIRHDLVFTKFDKAADQSPACSMLRWHPLEPQLLQPLLRTSEPGLFQMQPWANLLWLGLAAPLESFELVLKFCVPGPKGNPLALTYATGGNLVHALLQHRPGDTLIMTKLLDRLSATKTSCKHALNAVNEATQHTPLCLAVNLRQSHMAELLLDYGAEPLALSSYSKSAAAADASTAAGQGGPKASSDSTSGSTGRPAAVVCRTTLLHLLLGPDREQVLGAAHPTVQAAILQACIDAAVAEASAQRELQQQRLRLEAELAAAGSYADQARVAKDRLRELGAVPQHVLGAYADEEGETLALAAARYCCSTGDAVPMMLLVRAGADHTQPNRSGTSPLLLLLQHKASGQRLPTVARAWLEHEARQGWTRQMLLDVAESCSRVSAESVQLLLAFLAQLPWEKHTHLLRDVSLHEHLIKQQQWLLAQLLLQQAEQHLGPAAAAAVATAASGSDGSSGASSPGLFSGLLCHSYVCSIRPDILDAMLRLGLDPHKLSTAGQTLLHAALEGGCSAAVASRLVEGSSPLVLVWQDTRANLPLHYLAAWRNVHEPENVELLKMVLKRCFSSPQTLSGIVQRGHSGKLPHEIPAAAAVQAIMRRAFMAAELVSSADDRAAAAAAVAAQDDPFGRDDGDVQAAVQAAVAASEQRRLGADAQPGTPTTADSGAFDSLQPAAATADGTDDGTSQEQIAALLSALPASQQATEEAAAVGRQQHSQKWLQRAHYLSELLDGAVAGKAVLAGKSDAQHSALRAELLQLRDAVEGAAWLAWDNMWEATFTRDAFEQFAGMPLRLRQVVALRLHDLAAGRFQLQLQQHPGSSAALPGGCTTQHDMAQLAPAWRRRRGGISEERFTGLVERLAGVRVYSTVFLGVGRVLFEVAPDYVKKYKLYVDVLRIWAVTLTDEDHEEALDRILSSHSRADAVLEGVKLLRPLPHAQASSSSSAQDASLHEPRYYQQEDCAEQDAAEQQDGSSLPGGVWTPGCGETLPIAFAQRRPQLDLANTTFNSSGGGSGDGSSSSGALVAAAPPASHQPGEFTMLRLVDLTGPVMAKLVSPEGLDVQAEDVPFRLSRTEEGIVESVVAMKAATLVMGRSGTGKTTILLHAIFKLWHTAHSTPGSSYRCIFVTASPTLKQQVEAAFCKLQMAALKADTDRSRVLAARSRQYHTLSDVPDAAFPLFLSSRQYLAMLDASVGEPFLWNRDPDTMALLDAEDAAQQRMLEALLSQDDLLADAATPAGGQKSPGRPASRSRNGGGSAATKQRELTWLDFERMWRGKYERHSKTDISLALFFQELMSFVKGSADAVMSESGVLPLEEYLQLGRKRSENATTELRQKIYALLPDYTREKAQRGFYDRPDLVHSLYMRLSELGGAAEWDIHHIVRDEVQDFVQGELLLDALVLGPKHAHNILYCGDSAQTITRGVGFSFTDVKWMLSQQYKDLKATDRSLLLPDPEIRVLDINFRSHAGILDVGNAIVGPLRELSPHTIDRLPREHAFFEGPRPLLLGAMTAQDVAMLTAGRQGRKRQIEFGAHQVILVRSKDEQTLSAALPDGIKSSNALIMEVLQAKGLEFTDVLVCDYLSSHPTDAREWRVLYHYLLHQLEQHPAVKAEVEQAAAGAYGGAGSSMLDVMQQRGSGRQMRRLLEDVPLTQEERTALKEAAFDPNLHASLIDELKCMYVAVSRARNNLVLFESNPCARAALYYYLHRLGLAVEIKTSLLYAQDSLLASNGSSRSTPADWASRGISLVQQQDWEAAAHCFKQANDTLRQAACTARLLLEAPRAPRSSVHRAAVLLLQAAAGAADRHQQRAATVSAGGSSSGGGGGGQLPAIKPAEFGEWVALAAGLFGQVLGQSAVAVWLYCQVGNFKEARRMCTALEAEADQQFTVLEALTTVAVALRQAADSAAAAQQQASAGSGRQPHAGAEAGAAKAAATAALSQLHAACLQLLEACAAAGMGSGEGGVAGGVESVLRAASETAAQAEKRRRQEAAEAERQQQQEAAARRQALARKAAAAAAQQQQQQQQEEEDKEQQDAEAARTQKHAELDAAAGAIPDPQTVTLLSAAAARALPAARGDRLVEQLCDSGLQGLVLQLLEDPDGKLAALLRVPDAVMQQWLRQEDAGSYLQGVLDRLAEAEPSGPGSQQQPAAPSAGGEPPAAGRAKHSRAAGAAAAAVAPAPSSAGSTVSRSGSLRPEGAAAAAAAGAGQAGAVVALAASGGEVGLGGAARTALATSAASRTPAKAGNKAAAQQVWLPVGSSPARAAAPPDSSKGSSTPGSSPVPPAARAEGRLQRAKSGSPGGRAAATAAAAMAASPAAAAADGDGAPSSCSSAQGGAIPTAASPQQKAGSQQKQRSPARPQQAAASTASGQRADDSRDTAGGVLGSQPGSQEQQQSVVSLASEQSAGSSSSRAGTGVFLPGALAQQAGSGGWASIFGFTPSLPPPPLQQQQQQQQPAGEQQQQQQQQQHPDDTHAAGQQSAGSWGGDTAGALGDPSGAALLAAIRSGRPGPSSTQPDALQPPLSQQSLEQQQQQQDVVSVTSQQSGGSWSVNAGSWGPSAAANSSGWVRSEPENVPPQPPHDMPPPAPPQQHLAVSVVVQEASSSRSGSWGAQPGSSAAQGRGWGSSAPSQMTPAPSPFELPPPPPPLPPPPPPQQQQQDPVPLPQLGGGWSGAGTREAPNWGEPVAAEQQAKQQEQRQLFESFTQQVLATMPPGLAAQAPTCLPSFEQFQAMLEAAQSSGQGRLSPSTAAGSHHTSQQAADGSAATWAAQPPAQQQQRQPAEPQQWLPAEQHHSMFVSPAGSRVAPPPPPPPPPLPLPPQQQQQEQEQHGGWLHQQGTAAGVGSDGGGQGAASGSQPGGRTAPDRPRSPSERDSSSGSSSKMLVPHATLMALLTKRLRALEQEKAARLAAEEQVQQLKQELEAQTAQTLALREQQLAAQTASAAQASDTNDTVLGLLQQLGDNAANHGRELAAAWKAARQQLADQAALHAKELEAVKQQAAQGQDAATQRKLDAVKQVVRQLQVQLKEQAATHAAEMGALRQQQEQQLQQALAEQAQQHRAQVQRLQQQLEEQEAKHRRGLASQQQASAAKRLLSRAGLAGR